VTLIMQHIVPWNAS